MIGFSLFRRRGRPAGFLPALALALGALPWSLQPGNAADKPKEPNVIVDDSVLDNLAPATTGADLPLPAPAQAPLSRLLQPGEAAVSSQTPPTAAPDATVPAAPTTPIQATEIGAANSAPNANGTAAAPAAGGGSQAAAASAATAAPPPKDGASEQTAAKPPIEGMVRIPFEPESTALSDPAKTALAPLVEKLNADFSLRVEVLAYAAGTEQSSTHARGVSLGRALAIRSYLSEQGIAMNRMDLRALGNSAQEQPADRVDLIPTAQ
jgi:outer membrane protein OmpA-like peptidoglycan-associated protein